jgi:large subunit ribosomal protein L13
MFAKESEVDRQWWVVDLDGKTLGRAATEIAKILRGKHKPIFTPHVDTGDFVVVINAEKIVLTGNKWQQKMYRWHSGYPSGLREMTAEKLHKIRPEELVRRAVKGMLPKNKLGRRLNTKLKVYAGAEHPHQAQMPQTLEITT